MELRQRIAELEKAQDERKEARSALRESEGNYRIMVENANLGIIVAQDGRLRYANPRTSEFTGLSLGELINSPFLEHIHPDDREMVGLHYSRRIKGEGSPETYAFRAVDRKGRIRWIEIRSVMISWEGRPATLSFLRDISERIQMEEALQESEDRYRVVSQLTADIAYAFQVEPDGALLFEWATGALARITGFTPTELLSRERWESLVHPDDLPIAQSQLKTLLAGQQKIVEYRILTKNGKVRHMRDYGRPVWDEEQRRVVRIYGALRDISRRKRAEGKLRESEEKYRMLVETMNDGLAIGDENSVFVYVNNRFCDMLGYSDDELIGRSPTQFLDRINRSILEDQIERRQQGEQDSYELKWTRKDGRQISTIVSPKPIHDANGRFCGSFGVITDITEYKRVEQELRFLSSQLISAQENERGRIARELHDGLGQSLSAIKFKTEEIRDQIADGTVEEVLNSCAVMIPIIQNALEEVRRISADLRPSILDDLGVLATISWFCREFQKIYSSIHIEKETNLDEGEVPEPLKIVIFRVLQEALNNIAKHSKADKVLITLNKEEGIIEFAVRDNGQGFDLVETLSRKASMRGLGLGSMRERSELSGGRLIIESEEGKGTTIRLSWQPEMDKSVG